MGVDSSIGTVASDNGELNTVVPHALVGGGGEGLRDINTLDSEDSDKQPGKEQSLGKICDHG